MRALLEGLVAVERRRRHSPPGAGRAQWPRPGPPRPRRPAAHTPDGTARAATGRAMTAARRLCGRFRGRLVCGRRQALQVPRRPDGSSRTRPDGTRRGRRPRRAELAQTTRSEPASTTTDHPARAPGQRPPAEERMAPRSDRSAPAPVAAAGPARSAPAPPPPWTRPESQALEQRPVRGQAGHRRPGPDGRADARRACSPAATACSKACPAWPRRWRCETLADVIGGTFARLQFTPDLLPGRHRRHPDLPALDRDLRHRARARCSPTSCWPTRSTGRPAKVQSALLEVMAERQVSHRRHAPTRCPTPFLVLATQNPIESEGVYPLPEAQRDRFLMKVDRRLPETPTRSWRSCSG